MSERAFLREKHEHAGTLHEQLNQVLPGLVEAVSVVGHTSPNVVLVRLTREPTFDELVVLKEVCEG